MAEESDRVIEFDGVLYVDDAEADEAKRWAQVAGPEEWGRE